MTSQRPPNDACRTGAILIFVLWAIALLSLLAGGLAFAIRQDLAVATIQQDRLTAHWLARAGTEYAIAALMDAALPAHTEKDRWCDDASRMRDRQLAGGTYSVVHGSNDDLPRPLYGAGDECAKLNINVATREQIMKLPRMTAPIAGAILDWRDDNDQPEPDGIERGHYAALDHPYVIRNGPFRTVRELLLVRGITPELFYGEDTNANGILDPNEDDGDASEPADNADGRLDRGWYAWLTAYSYEKNVSADGRQRLNLNTADAGTLGRRLDLPMWAAESIVKARDRKNDKKFEHLVDLLDVERDSTAQPTDATAGSDRDEKPVPLSTFVRIVDDLSLNDDQTLVGRININTAPREVLKTLPDITDERADAIVRYRQNNIYTSIGELMTAGGLTREQFAKIEGHVTVRSCVFRIKSHGYADSGLAEAAIECVVDVGGIVPRVLYWLESAP